MLKSDYILQVRSDILFHDLFNENDIKAIEWLASQILECEVSEITGKVRVANIRRPRINKSERIKYLDLIIEYDNKQVIIELNNNSNSVYLRNFLYAINTLLSNYNKNIETNDYYTKETRVILVNLCWFKNKNNQEKVKLKEEIVVPYPSYINNDDKYILKIVNINLDKYDSLCYDKVTKFDKLFKLLTSKTVKELEEFKEVKELDFYSNKLKSLSIDDKYMEVVMDENIEKNVQAYELYQSGLSDGIEEGIQKGIEEGIQKGIEEGIQKGIEEGRKEGIQKGILKRTIELAKSLLLKKVDINIISEATGLSLEEINNLNV